MFLYCAKLPLKSTDYKVQFRYYKLRKKSLKNFAQNTKYASYTYVVESLHTVPFLWLSLFSKWGIIFETWTWFSKVLWITKSICPQSSSLHSVFLGVLSSPLPMSPVLPALMSGLTERRLRHKCSPVLRGLFLALGFLEGEPPCLAVVGPWGQTSRERAGLVMSVAASCPPWIG